MGLKNFIIAILSIYAILIGCKPDNSGIKTNDLAGISINYGDSILYLKNVSGDVVVSPLPVSKTGRYYAFPDGLDINPNTGAINISKSETGMKYKIMFVPDGTSDTISTRIILSGINYKDYYHIQAANDTLSRPFYNANFSNFNLPCSGLGCSFDTDGSARAEGLAIDPGTGIINLKKSIQNGLLGASNPTNGSAKEVLLKFRLNDASNMSANEIKVKLYYFNTRNDVDNNLNQLVIDRNDMFLRLSESFAGTPLFMNRTNASKPRPPCIIILGS